MTQVVAQNLHSVFVVWVVSFLLWESIKEGCEKSVAEGKVVPTFFYHNRWTVLVPAFLVAYWISLDFLQPVFEFLALGIVAFAEFEFRTHVVGSLGVGSGAALLVGLAAAAAYFIYMFWRARLRWGAFLFFILTLLATSLAFKAAPKAEQKVQTFYSSFANDRALAEYIMQQEAVSEALAEYLVSKWHDYLGTKKEQEQQNIAIAFYSVIALASVPATWVWVRFFTLMQIHLLRRSANSERG